MPISRKSVHAGLLLGLAALALAAPGAEGGVFRALMVGPNYPGGGFDAQIAATRMQNMSAQFARWGNWNANNITVLNGGVTPNQITNAIANSGAGANDVFVFMYHGHGTYAGAPLPGGNPAGDPPAEQFWLPGGNTLGEGAIQAALAALPARKLFINLSCYGGGMWNPVQNANPIAFMAGCGERQTLPENVPANGVPVPSGQPFYWNLFQNADPTNIANVDTNRDNRISIGEWYNASAVGGSMFANRWDEDFLGEVQSDFQSELQLSSSDLLNTDVFLVPTPASAALGGMGLLLCVRRRRR